MISTNIPVLLTSFIGREHDLNLVEGMLSTSHLVTLTGIGGSGKTRLAIQVGNRVCKDFPDGVWMVDLVPLQDPALVPQLVVQTLGLHLAPDQPVLEALQSFLHKKRLLLLLDNCEHLRPACARLCLQILSQAAEVRILATSREPLAIAGERVFPLSGLAWPKEHESSSRNGVPPFSLQELAGYDAVRLFVERARLISPEFNLTSENAHAVVEICRRLDGLPLAIELASARANVLTIQEISARLDDRFGLLTSGRRAGIDSRHQTLRAAIDWSYTLLSPEEQVLLRRLAVFSSGCALEAAVAICAQAGEGSQPALELLSSLVDKSLIIAETSGRAQARYRMLETIHEYAREKLGEAGEVRQMRDRHLDYFLARSEEAAPKLNDAYQQLWVNWLEGEHDNLRAALSWALKDGRIEEGLRMATALVRFWEIRSLQQEALSWLERLLVRAGQNIDPVVRVNAYTWASFLSLFQGEASASVEYAREAVNIAEAVGSEFNAVRAFALAGLAMSARGVGDYQTAFTVGERTLQYYREAGSLFHLGMGLLSLGDTAIELGEYTTARSLLDESLALAMEAGDNFRIALTYNAFGDLARYEEKYTEALAAYQKGEAQLRKLGAQHHLASVLANLGRIYLRLGEVERACTLFNESLAIYQAEQDRPGQIECLVGFSSAAVKNGQSAAGVRLLAAAEAVGRQRAAVWPAKRIEYNEYLELARLGLTEADFQEEQAAGRIMTLKQAIQYAQNLPRTKGNPDLTKREEVGELTGRERQVAGLIAQGKSNREIAEDLVLSTRTVEKHVANILSKLGLASRSQIVRWAMEHDLN